MDKACAVKMNLSYLRRRHIHMTVITLDVIQTVGLAVLVFVVGRYIKSKVTFFQKYF